MQYATQKTRLISQSPQVLDTSTSLNPANSRPMSNALLQPSGSRKPGHTPGRPTGGGTSIVKQDDPICTVDVTCGALNVRNSPSTSAARIGGVTRGKTLNVYEVKDGWLRIGYGTEYGWVMAKYTTYKEDPVVIDPPDPDPDPDPDPTECLEDLHAKYGTITIGSSGEGVKVMKQYLNKYLKDESTVTPLEENTTFDKKTFINLGYYQYSRNLQSGSKICVDGICGSGTWKALCTNAERVYDLTTPKVFSSYQYKGVFQGKEISGGGALTEKAVEPFNRMYADAKAAGHDLAASNTYRGMTSAETKNGANQNIKGQIEYFADYKYHEGSLAADPGNSNHQHGLAVDIKKINHATDKEYVWLEPRGESYGFEAKVENEPWHWKYFK